MGAALEEIVKHDGRLDVLCCLLGGEAQAIKQLSAQTGMSETAVRHHVELLDLFDLVRRMDGTDGEPLYLAELGGHPEWVRAAVKKHRNG